VADEPPIPKLDSALPGVPPGGPQTCPFEDDPEPPDLNVPIPASGVVCDGGRHVCHKRGLLSQWGLGTQVSLEAPRLSLMATPAVGLVSPHVLDSDAHGPQAGECLKRVELLVAVAAATAARVASIGPISPISWC
jgi:hypothetical protein